MDALPSLLLLGYGLANLQLPEIKPLRRAGRGADLTWAALQTFGAALAALSVAFTAVNAAGAVLGVLLGLHFPLRQQQDRGRLVTYVGSVCGFLVVMPRAAVIGLVLSAAVYILTRRIVLSATAGLVFVPPIAWIWQGSDLSLLFGMLVVALLLYAHLDDIERSVRQLAGTDDTPLFFRRAARRLLIVTLLLACTALFFFNRYVYHGFGLHPDIFRRGSEELRYVALTFDDGPHPRFTRQILDTLQERDVRATFFVVGRHVDRYPEVVRRMLDEGHEVGSHTYNHLNMLRADEETTISELSQTEQALKRAADFTPRLFRPPRGLYNSTVLQVAHDRGYTMALWSLSSQDWLGTSPRRMVRSITSQTSGGDILLFHDSGDFFTAAGADRTNTVAALGPIIDNLREEGYEFVTVTELMILTLMLEGAGP